jgi:hypothetical protein
LATRRVPRNKETPPASPQPPPSPLTPHPFIKWMRTAAIAGFLGGLSGLFLIEWFWVGVALIYLSFLVLLIDVWFEPELTRRWKIGVTVGIIVLSAGFSWKFVFVPAPLQMQAIITDGEYAPGTNLHGIIWKKGFTELRLFIWNSSDHDYDNLNLLIQPTEPIAAIAQGTNVSGITLSDNKRLMVSPVDVNHATGQQTAIPVVILATDAGYRMSCPRLSRETSIEIVMALAEMKNPPEQPSQKPPLENKDFMLRIRFDDSTSYWLGYPDGDDYLPQRPSTETVKIEGKYNAALRTRSITEKVKVSGHIPINLR